VYVQFIYDSPARAEPKLQSETDSNGEAEFNIPPLISIPRRIWVTVALDSQRWHCNCTLASDTESVLQNGAVRQTRKSKTPARASPGVIVFYARPFTLLDKIMWAIFRGEL